jgi:hypothetical protein
VIYLKAIAYIKGLARDLARCVFIGLFIAAIFAVLMVIVTLISGWNWLDLLYRSYFYIGSLGLLIAGLSFLKPSTLRPLDYKNDWERYFKKMNIGFVFLFVGITLMVIAVVLYNIRYYQTI